MGRAARARRFVGFLLGHWLFLLVLSSLYRHTLIIQTPQGIRILHQKRGERSGSGRLRWFPRREGFRHLGFKDDHDINAAEWSVYDALYAYCQEMVRRGKMDGAFK